MPERHSKRSRQEEMRMGQGIASSAFSQQLFEMHLLQQWPGSPMLMRLAFFLAAFTLAHVDRGS